MLEGMAKRGGTGARRSPYIQRSAGPARSLGRLPPTFIAEQADKSINGEGVPLGFHLDSAQRAEVRPAQTTLATVRVAQRRGRPKTRPQEVVAEKGYDSQTIREWLRSWGTRPRIPRRCSKRPRLGRPADLTAYRERWKVERTFAWLGNYRRLLIRWERHLSVYQGCFTFVLMPVRINRLVPPLACPSGRCQA
jgi:transposase